MQDIRDEVEKIIQASLLIHYENCEKQTEIEHDELLKENEKLRKQIKELKGIIKEHKKKENPSYLEAENKRLRSQNIDYLNEIKRLRNQVQKMSDMLYKEGRIYRIQR